MKHGLKESTTEEIREIFSRYPQVEKAVLYGSRAKETIKTDLMSILRWMAATT